MPLTQFYTNKDMKDGYMSRCKSCESERCKAKTIKRKDEQLSKAKEWRMKNKEKLYAACLAWRKRNPERCAAYYVDYRNRNRGVVNERWMRREVAKKNATPKWLNEDDIWMMAEIYDLSSLRTLATGILWHVDHIVPLQGKTVSGLHVPWNLRVITAKENQMKSNQLFAQQE